MMIVVSIIKGLTIGVFIILITAGLKPLSSGVVQLYVSIVMRMNKNSLVFIGTIRQKIWLYLLKEITISDSTLTESYRKDGEFDYQPLT